MADAPRIFISHNAAHNEASKLLLEQILEALRAEKDATGAPRFEVLVDRDLKAAELWRGPLYTWMLNCDAAVMIIDDKTPHTTWVPREAMIFSWRQQLDERFTLLPLLRGVGKEIFDTPALKEMGIEALNYTTTEDVRELIDLLKALVPVSLDQRLDQVADFLNARCTPTAFKKAKDLFMLDAEWAFMARFDPGRAIASMLLGLGFRGGPFPPGIVSSPSARALRTLADWVDERHQRRIVEMLRSYFVAREVGAELYRAVKNQQVIALQVHLAHTAGWAETFIKAHFAEAYSQSFAYRPRVLRIAPLLATNGMDDEITTLKNAVHLTLLPGVPIPTRAWSFHDDLRFALYRQPSQERPETFLWAMDNDPIRIDHLVRLQQDLPGLRVIYLWTGSDPPDHDEVRCIHTKMNEDAEEIAFREIDKATSLITE